MIAATLTKVRPVKVQIDGWAQILDVHPAEIRSAQIKLYFVIFIPPFIPGFYTLIEDFNLF
jgi:hypothetical protein